MSPSILKSIANQEPSLEPNAVVLERLLVRPFELRFSDETPFQLDIALLHSFTTFNLMTLEALSIDGLEEALSIETEALSIDASLASSLSHLLRSHLIQFESSIRIPNHLTQLEA